MKKPQYYFLLSILVISFQYLYSAGEPHKKLSVYKNLGIGPCIDIAIEKDLAFIIGSGQLFVANITLGNAPVIKSKYSGLGNVRQVLAKEGKAYVASREDGVFIFDVRNPLRPILLCHYNSVEVATGIGISGNVLFICNRTFGVEIVDVSNPQKPLFLSLIRSGESQSIDIRNGYAYIGVHGAKYLVTANVKNPRKPVITSSIKLDGQGDGVYVQGQFLYVSTGNNSRSLPNKKKGDPGYGTGHGLEIYDLAIPGTPEFISKVKFDTLHTFPDMWSVEVSGDYAFCSDTANGTYVVNINNIKSPKVTGHFPVSALSKGKRDNYSGGAGVVDDYLYVAAGGSDMHLVALKGIAKKQTRAFDNSIKVGPENPVKPNGYRLFRPEGQAWDVDVADGVGVAACGMGGWCTFTLGKELKEIKKYPTDGFAMGIASRGDYVYVGTGNGKVSVWKHLGQGAFDKIYEYKSSRQASIRKLLIPDESKYLIMQVGMNTLEVADLTEPGKPIRALAHKSTGYINEVMGNNLLQNRYTYAAWHTKGLDWIDLKKNPPGYSGKTLMGRGIRGVCAMGDKLVVFTLRGYKVATLDDKDLKSIKEKKFTKSFVVGTPVVYGKYIITSNRREGKVSIIDMSDLNNAVVEKTITTTVTPSSVKVYDKTLIIPDGYGGIRVYDDFFCR